jgi:iron complex transport system substrate-binding protein
MTGYYRHLVFCFLLVLLGSGTAAETPHRTVTDLVGRQVVLPRSPRRVVTLAPNITEMVFAIGRQERLVGVTRFSDYPEAARQLPKVGSYVQLDLERIVALKPDLCLAIRDGNPQSVITRLEQMGIAVYAVDPRDLDSVMQTLLALGEILKAAPRAQAIVTAMRQRVTAVTGRVATAAGRPRVFFQIGISPIVSVGSNTFIDELIRLAGGRNVAAGPAPYPRFSVEQVLALAPEVIVITSMDRMAVFQQVKDGWQRWPHLPAVQRQAIYIAPSNLFDRPTPRLVDGLELLARQLHPALFEAAP